jgi:hypothetical protein
VLPDAPFVRPDPLHLSFEGFHEAGLAALARLKAEPTVARYQLEKAAIRAGIQEPFGRYRDDLAVNWVLPNGLPFETEKGVFSRILKNDFGAGGSHHHLWMSFYRPPRKRLTDVQLSHAVTPDAFRWGLYAGDYARGLFAAARARLFDEPDAALALLNGLLARDYRLAWAPHVTKPDGHPETTEPLDALPDGLRRAKGLWLMKRIDGDAMRALGPGLVAAGIDAQAELWPLYSFLAGAER